MAEGRGCGKIAIVIEDIARTIRIFGGERLFEGKARDAISSWQNLSDERNESLASQDRNKEYFDRRLRKKNKTKGKKNMRREDDIGDTRTHTHTSSSSLANIRNATARPQILPCVFLSCFCVRVVWLREQDDVAIEMWMDRCLSGWLVGWITYGWCGCKERGVWSERGSITSPSYLLYLLADHYRIVLSYLLSAELFIVKGALVLVRISV